MSNVQNNTGLNINIYQAPLPSRDNCAPPSAFRPQSNDIDLGQFTPPNAGNIADNGLAVILLKRLLSSPDNNQPNGFDASLLSAALKNGSIGQPCNGNGNQIIEQVVERANLLKFIMNGKLPNNTSEFDTAKTIMSFQQSNGNKLLSDTQLKEMAGGYLTDGGKTVQVPQEVAEAAAEMMDNDGALFKKLETSIRREPDRLLSSNDFQAAVNQGMLNTNQQSPLNNDNTQLSNTDQMLLERMLLEAGLQQPQNGNNNSDALQQLLAALNLSTTDGGNSTNLPSSSDAAKILFDLQGQQNIGLLTNQQVQEMATKGTITNGNQTTPVSQEVQNAAVKAMENNGQLFKTLESAITGDFDGKLSRADYTEAIEDGSIGQPSPGTSTGGTQANGNVGNTGPGTKSEYGSMDTMKEFQKNTLGKEPLSRDQVQQIATEGKLTKANGVTVTPPPEVVEAAKTLMANNGAVFDKIEVAHNGKKDNLISLADYRPAMNQSVKENTNTIADFQKSEMKGDFLSRANLQQIADSGTLTKKDGSVIEVPKQVQEAARNYVDNDAKLFKAAESSQNGKQDDKLSVRDSRTLASSVD